MAEHGRGGGDHQMSDRERSRYGRDTGDDRAGWGRDRDRAGEPPRGGGMFGSSGGRGDEDWTSGRREELGWGGGDRDRASHADPSHSGRSHSAHPMDRPHMDRSQPRSDERGWGGGGRPGHGDRHHDDRQRERAFGSDDGHEGLPIDETSRLIASNKVEGTAVYARDGRRLGSIYNFMVDKRSGKAEYAVMSYGGFLGMGTRYYPMPWDLLSYDTRLGGYRVDMLERDLERAPSFDRDSEPSFDTSYGRRVRGWYGLGN